MKDTRQHIKDEGGVEERSGRHEGEARWLVEVGNTPAEDERCQSRTGLEGRRRL
jgi:hypothetical protein